MRILTALALISILSISFICGIGCSTPPPQEKEYVVAFVPSVESQSIIDQIDEFDAALSKALGAKVTSRVMPSYAACILAMGSGKVDVGFLPPMAYVIANSRYGVKVVLKAERNGSTFYRGEIIVRNDSGIDKLEDLAGKKIAFVEAASTSGHLFAKALLKEHGVNYGADDDLVLFAGSHTASVQAVVQGKVDAAACYDDARKQAIKNAPDVMEVTKVLGYTKDIPGDTVSVAKEFDPAKLKILVDTLKGMANGKEGILYKIYEIEGLKDATDTDYNIVRDMGSILDIDFWQFMEKDE